MDEKERIELEIADAIMGRPYGFAVEDRHFYLYPVTLGKMFLLQRQIEELGINEINLSFNVSLEALRLVRDSRDTCLSILTYHTCKTKEEVFDDVANEEKKTFLDKGLTDDELASLMILVLTKDRTEGYIRHLGIDKENDSMQTVMRVKAKSDKNSLSFGGKSRFGTLIDMACERYGWTKDYVVWGIDYTSLRLMLADKIVTVYISDEERKKLPASLLGKDDDVIKASKENMEKIMSMDWR